jgi:hypothetical protein
LAIADAEPEKALILAKTGEFIGLSLIEADSRRMLGRDATATYDSLLTELPPYARGLRAAIIVRKAGIADSSAVDVLWGSRQWTCNVRRGSTVTWACADYLIDTKQFQRAAAVLSEFDISATLPEALQDEFAAFLLQREANIRLLAREYDEAEVALRKAMLTDYVRQFPYIGELLLDRIKLALFLRDNKTTPAEV